MTHCGTPSELSIGLRVDGPRTELTARNVLRETTRRREKADREVK
jgi:hypothetical protein